MTLETLQLDQAHANDPATRYAAELTATGMVSLLATLGYQGLKIELRRCGPVCGLARVGGDPIEGVDLDRDLPGPLHCVGRQTVRNCAETLAALGVTGLRIKVSPEERDHLRALWHGGDRQAAPAARGPFTPPAPDARVREAPKLPVVLPEGGS